MLIKKAGINAGFFYCLQVMQWVKFKPANHLSLLPLRIDYSSLLIITRVSS